MPFDGIDYTDALKIPKVLTHPRAPFLGVLASQLLRGAYFRARHHGQGLGTWAAPADGIVGAELDRIFRTDTNTLQVVARESKWVAPHFTHGLCQCVFSGRMAESSRARFQLGAGNSETARLDFGDAVDLPLLAESVVDQAAAEAAESEGDGRGLWEVIVAVELANTTKGQFVNLDLLGGAERDFWDTGISADILVAVGLQIESSSVWVLSVE